MTSSQKDFPMNTCDITFLHEISDIIDDERLISKLPRYSNYKACATLKGVGGAPIRIYALSGRNLLSPIVHWL